MAGVKLSAEELAGATEIAPVKLSAEDLAGATEIAAPAKRPFLSEVAARAKAEAEPLAHLSAPESLSDLWERLKQNAPVVGRGVVEGVKGIGRTVDSATKFAGHALVHPLDTLSNAPAVGNEALRGVYGNVPLLNLVNERAFGVPETSAEDAAAAPGAREFGSLVTPLLGKAGEAGAATAGKVARSVGEGTVERSAARAAISDTPVKDQLVKAVGAAKGHAKEAAAAALLGHGAGFGHAGGAYAAGRIGLPFAKAGAIATDEAAASIARRMGVKPALAAAAEPEAVAAAVAPAEAKAGPLDELKRQAAALDAKAAPVSGDPQINELRALLKDADPKQAEVIKGAIAGLEEKAARIGPKHAPERKTVQIPVQSNADLVYGAPAGIPGLDASGAKPELWGGRPANLDTPEWSPSDADVKHAKGLNMTVPEYRDLLARMQARGAAK